MVDINFAHGAGTSSNFAHGGENIELEDDMEEDPTDVPPSIVAKSNLNFLPKAF
jgi:hypothetical protein